MKKEHSLRRMNDQVFCEKCGRQWDLDDTDREITPCKRESRVGDKAIDAMRKLFSKPTLHSDK
jgi:hypothetical protein